MSSFTCFVLFVLIMVAIVGVFYWFKLQLIPDEPDFTTARRQKIMERRAKKQRID